MTFLIRPALPQDLASIAHIYNREIREGTATWNIHERSLAEFDIWLNDLNTQGFPLFVAIDDATQCVAGFADYSSFRSIHGFKQTVEHSVFINPQFSRQGLGLLLMNTLIKHAKAHDIHVMVAAIDGENMASIRLHKKLGFQQTGFMPEVGQKFGKWRDLVLLQLNF